MLINAQTLRGIYVGFNTIFNKALETVKPLYNRISTVTNSTTDTETYAWLGAIPQMREWIGDRQIKNLTSSGYTIKNKKFEATVGIPRDAIEDDKIGLYNPSIQMLAESAAQHPDKLVFALLASGFKEKCYDKKPFFAEDHPVGNNKGTFSNKGKAALSLESYIAARAGMMSLTDENGSPLAIVPDLLVVPPALEAKAREILVADIVNGTRNTMANTAEVLVAPWLAGNDKAWFLLDTHRPVKPIIVQKRKAPKFVSKTDEKDDNVFLKDTYLYGVDYRGNVGFGFPQMAYGSEGTGE